MVSQYAHKLRAGRVLCVFKRCRPGMIMGVAGLTVLALLAASWPWWVLEVFDADSGRVLWSQRVEADQMFTLAWTHSVSKQEVRETYRVEGPGSLRLEAMVFPEPGPNLPANPDEGTRWEIGEGSFRVTGYDLVLPEVSVGLGNWIARHRLLLDGQEISLDELHPAGGLVRLRVRTLTVAKYLVQEVHLWPSTG